MVDAKDIKKGLVVFDDCIGLLIADCVTDDGRLSCNNGSIITDLRSVSRVDMDFLKSRRVTQADLDKHNAFI